jgi:hypothetical protein
MIRHTVSFRLRPELGAAGTERFFAAAQALSLITGVERFERLRQVSAKSAFTDSFSLEFADQDGYDAYNADPLHVAFLRDYWATSVAEAQELDFVPAD